MKKLKYMILCLLMCSVLSFTAVSVFAAEAPAEEGNEGYMEELPGDEDYEEEQPQEQPVETQAAESQAEEQPVETQAEAQEQPEQEEFHDRDYYYNAEENAYIEELPTIDSDDVQIATILKIPVSEVTDTSLMGGIAAWLCVAVGIAVIVGVLVSKKTSNVRR